MKIILIRSPQDMREIGVYAKSGDIRAVRRLLKDMIADIGMEELLLCVKEDHVYLEGSELNDFINNIK